MCGSGTEKIHPQKPAVVRLPFLSSPFPSKRTWRFGAPLQTCSELSSVLIPHLIPPTQPAACTSHVWHPRKRVLGLHINTALLNSGRGEPVPRNSWLSGNLRMLIFPAQVNRQVSPALDITFQILLHAVLEFSSVP